MKVTIQSLGDFRFAAEARGHMIVSDQPAANGGTDEGMTPPELLLASLGTCAGYYAIEYLRTRGLPTDELMINVSAEKALGPARFSEFQVTVALPALEERHVDGLLRAVKACMVHHTLQHQPPVAFDVVIETPAQTAV